LLSALLVVALCPPQAAAQQAPVLSPAALKTLRFDEPAKPPPTDTKQALKERRRACPGCPPRNLLLPYLESLGLNVMYNGINHLRGHETARVGINTWQANLKSGFEWDVNPWEVNQIGHPYQGSNYFTAGRAHGLTFWEAASVAAFGSATWEFFAENNRASLNDLVNTTLGGIALGEVMHRAAWLIRDPSRPRKSRELIAAAIDPMSYLARAMSGDAKKAADKPADLIPSSIGSGGTVGVVIQGRSLWESHRTARPYVEMDLEYGDVKTGRSRTPFGAFTVSFAGGGSRFGQALIRGRLYGRPAGRFQLTVFQTFDFIVNRAYSFGAQGVELDVATRIGPVSATSLWFSVNGGANILGAVDSLIAPPDGSTPEERPDRQYDYGPGGRIGAVVRIERRGWPFLAFDYQGYQVSVVDGGRSNHVLQRAAVTVRAPLSHGLSVGLASEMFYRKVFVFHPTSVRRDESPQFRLFLAWDRR
jgi:hypothetical protein